MNVFFFFKHVNCCMIFFPLFNLLVTHLTWKCLTKFNFINLFLVSSIFKSYIKWCFTSICVLFASFLIAILLSTIEKLIVFDDIHSYRYRNVIFITRYIFLSSYWKFRYVYINLKSKFDFLNFFLWVAENFLFIFLKRS